MSSTNLESRKEEVTFCGRTFHADDISLIREMVEDCMGLSRTELAHTVCELLEWKRPTGRLKARECKDLLELLEDRGYLELPEQCDTGRRKGVATVIPETEQGEAQEPLTGTVKDHAPIVLQTVTAKDDQLLWRELVGRYHYLGFKVPFGAHHRYFIRAERSEPTIVGCLQFSSPAWRMASRDQWIGWDETTRKRNLQRIVNNSRFLILPWVQIRNLASSVLSLASKTIAADWEQRYAVRPVLLETLVDPSRYTGTCYRAANWLQLGTTTGRGRMDREHKRDGLAPKELFVYPLEKNFRKVLLS